MNEKSYETEENIEDDICGNCGKEEMNCICFYECDLCHQLDGKHSINCPNDDSPFSLLIKEGYD